MAEAILPRWNGQTCVVAATGPGLSQEIAEQCARLPSWVPVIAVNDAYRRIPSAEILFTGDRLWIAYHRDCPGFRGWKWASDSRGDPRMIELAEKHGYRIIRVIEKPGFSYEIDRVHSGLNSGFQAVNMAILLGAARILLVGFDMRGDHFFGKHAFRSHGDRSNFAAFIAHFRHAAKELPPTVEIVNCTPNSDLDCFPFGDFGDYVAEVAA